MRGGMSLSIILEGWGLTSTMLKKNPTQILRYEMTPLHEL